MRESVSFPLYKLLFFDYLPHKPAKEVPPMALSVNNKRWCLVRAVEIAKEFGRGGSDKTPIRILKDSYKVLKELLEDVHQEEVVEGSEETREL